MERSMKPIDVIKKLVQDNPNDMMLGEVVRQYIRELEPPQNWIEGMSRDKKDFERYRNKHQRHFAEGFHEGKWEEDLEYKTWPGLNHIMYKEHDEKISE